MSILSRLASAAGSKEQTANIEAARYIANNNDTHAIGELIHHLQDKQKAIRHDCIKTLYEIADIKPELVAEYTEVFIGLLRSKDNRMQWGAMTMLASVANVQQDLLFAHLEEITDVAKAGSVITMDHCISILIGLGRSEQYAPATFPILLSLLNAAPDNQLPAYAEKTLPVIKKPFLPEFIRILEQREKTITPESKRKRVTKVLQKLRK